MTSFNLWMLSQGLCIFIRERYWFIFFFLIVSLSHSGVSVTLTNENCWEVSLTLGKKLLKTRSHCFLRRERCHPHSHLRFPGVSAGRFLITSAIDLMDTGLLQPLVSSCAKFAHLCPSTNPSISSALFAHFLFQWSFSVTLIFPHFLPSTSLGNNFLFFF